MKVKLAAVPNFPLPSKEYDPASIIKLENVLRLYLNNLNNEVNDNTIEQVNTDTMMWLGGWGGCC